MHVKDNLYRQTFIQLVNGYPVAVSGDEMKRVVGVINHLIYDHNHVIYSGLDAAYYI